MESLKYIIIPVVTAIISQCIKSLIEFIKYKKFSLERFIFGMGGMPSTHSTLVSSVSTIIYLNYGMSSFFSVTLIFSLIVIYDSIGIRYESGKHAKIINEIVGCELEENIGHKPIEMFVGIILGIVITLILHLIIK